MHFLIGDTGRLGEQQRIRLKRKDKERASQEGTIRTAGSHTAGRGGGGGRARRLQAAAVGERDPHRRNTLKELAEFDENRRLFSLPE